MMRTSEFRGVEFWLAIVFSLLLPHNSHAQSAQYGAFTVFPSESAVLLDGRITSTSASDFKHAIGSIESLEVLVLASPGGSVAAALEIGHLVSQRGVTTLVPENEICASACSLIYLAGARRIALGALGVHQMSSDSPTALIGVQYMLAEVLSAFDEFNVDDRVIQRMLRTPPQEMHFFSEAEKSELGINSLAVNHAPKPSKSFTDYRVRVYSGQPVLPDFSGRDAWARMFRTRIREMVEQGVNFAGRYAIVEIGCGTNCRFAFVADISTGEVFRFPYGGEEQYQLGLVYSADSSLLRATWRETTTGKSSSLCVSQDLIWSGHSFEVLNESRRWVDGWYCSIDY